MSIGARLKHWRNELGWSQKEVSTASGVPYSSYQKYEQDRAEPGAGSLQMLRSVGLNVDWLLSNEGQMLACESLENTGQGYVEPIGVLAARGKSGIRNTDSPRLRMALALQLGRQMNSGQWCPSSLDIDTSDRLISRSLASILGAYTTEEQEVIVMNEHALDAALRLAFEAIGGKFGVVCTT